MPKRNKLEIILKGKCPRCHSGEMFKYKAYNLRKFDEMHENCPVCDLRFEREPGFFYGAMYVSYAFSVALFVILGTLIYNVLGDPDIWVYASIIFGTVLGLLPLLFRYSRIIYLHVFGRVKYDESVTK